VDQDECIPTDSASRPTFGPLQPVRTEALATSSIAGPDSFATDPATNPLLWPKFQSAYDWRQVHADLENGNYSGCYGWDNAAYWGIAECKAGVDLREWYKRRTKDEFYLPEVKELIDQKETQAEWENIFMFDPMGMYAHPPTIAACKANLDIPELADMQRDGKVIRDDGQVRTQKIAISYAWNLPRLSQRLDMGEEELREALYKHSNNPDLKDPTKKVYIPAVGGCTVYTFGDVRKIRDPRTEICVRVHDECIGSDVFGSDICTCRPYLIFALEQCVACAQRGGVGIVIYYRKEGRSLGEVTKFRVYNARENQSGGDRPEEYFNQTEQIAGIRDARFQAMMPDALKWLGIKRIDWLCSMSNEKYEAIVGAGIKVMQRVTLPEDYVKENMKVEITAKVASGYNTDTMDAELISLEAMSLDHVRKQTGRVFALAEQNKLDHFTLDMSKLPAVCDYVEQVIRKYYPNNQAIPPHSRMRHVEGHQIYNDMRGMWKCDKIETTKRMIDLMFVACLLDAGAGAQWKYSHHGTFHKSSEGLGVAALEMFTEGKFSSDPAQKHRVNSLALKKLDVATLARCLQINKNNQITGLENRCNLMNKLGEALEANPDIFGAECARPGNLLDFALKNGGSVSMKDLWKACGHGLASVWPKHASGIQTGDIWHLNKLTIPGQPGSDLVSFHKLTQWLLYSVIEVIEVGLQTTVDMGTIKMTALPEYRNGGLLVDMGVLSLKNPADALALHSVGSELIVEWRAMTVVLIEKIFEELKRRMPQQIQSLAQVLEGGTWRAGRLVAREQRPGDGGPPIKIRSDATVF
jgi:GTP cyclohydrolase II